MKLVEFIGFVDRAADVEDGGLAMIAAVEPLVFRHGEDSEFFVRLQSWSEEKKHKTLKSLLGKRVKITIEECHEEEG